MSPKFIIGVQPLTCLLRIKQNALASPLLRLPLEIRNKIWSEVLGNRLVHLRYLKDNKLRLSFEANEELYPHGLIAWYRSAWRHVVCEEDCPEKQEEKKFTLSDGGVLSIPAHYSCGSYLSTGHIEPGGLEMMDLRVLRSCRQTYVEANQLLWTTNTFSFSDAMTFERFMMTRTINQKRSIRSLRLHMEWESNEFEEWKKVLNMRLVQSLYTLRRLRLRIVRKIDTTGYEYAKSTNILYGAACRGGLKKISTLPLTEVEVVVKNSLDDERSDPQTKLVEEEFAEGLRRILLSPNPKGAEIHVMTWLKWKVECQRQQQKAGS